MRRFIGNLIRASDRMLPSWLHNDIAFLIAGSALTIVIGGQFNLAKRIPGKEEFYRFRPLSLRRCAIGKCNGNTPGVSLPRTPCRISHSRIR